MPSPLLTAVAGFPRVRDQYDFVVAGGGHAGLQAALKAGLLHHSALLLDKGPKYSRSYYAPKMDNIPGFPEGVSGHKLLDAQIAALRPQADRVTYVTPALVTAARRSAEGFEVDYEWLRQKRTVRARALVLALGVVDRMPAIDGKIDDVFPWANLAIVDFCLFCDGHDMAGRSIAVLGHDAYTARLALDLVHFEPSSLEILTNGEPFLAASPPEERRSLEEQLRGQRIGWFDARIAGYDGIRDRQFHVRFADGSVRKYDRGFSGLGWWDMNSAIPRSLGCAFDPEGYVRVDDDCRALAEAGGEPIPGLYVVGDLKTGWNQIPEAWASAERAVIHAYGYYL
ncbi:MAG TPA: NAD(P)/FAD-dependent oxidoreductase [Thermoplasmata archaeon]|nr:NAD(P)/FAD-dependent oxidoreductase [Thermoplasmata archaeon]